MSYETYWAKTNRKDLTGQEWRPYPEHIVAVVACAIVLCRRRPLLVAKVAKLLRITPAQAVEFIILAAALHDVGKLSCLFQAKNPAGFARAYGHPGHVPYTCDAYKGGRLFARSYNHGNDGFYLHLSCAGTKHMGLLPPTLMMAFYAGSWHHGSTMPLPNRSSRFGEIDDWWKSRAQKWAEPEQDARVMSEFLQDVVTTHTTPDLPDPRTVKERADYTEGLQVVAGIVGVADWFGSNEDIFPTDLTWTPRKYQAAFNDLVTHAGADRAVEEKYLGTLPPLLGTFAPATPSALQACVQNHLGRLVIIEAPTGDGKTEAALLLFEALLRAGLVDHLVFGLPTQATTNMMYDRIREEFKKVFGDGSLVQLHHGEARGRIKYLRDEVADALRRNGGNSNGIDSVDFGWEWLRSGKRAMLAPAAVVTVDQILMVALSGHLHKFVRQMALSTAFLVIDEVHALDTYMSGILVHALKVLARSGTHVALLSATLTDSARKQLVDAFADGLDVKVGALPTNPEATRITALYEDGRVEGEGVRSMRQTSRINVKHRPHGWVVQEGIERAAPADVEKMARSLAQSVRDGACVGWIRTTVWDVQATIDILRQVAPDITVVGAPLDKRETVFLHASLCSTERSKVEVEVTKVIGKDGEGVKRRPILVVGTSLLGISLDIDFDRLVVDLTTLDALLQAAGRLHRHWLRTRPKGFKKKVIEVFAPHAALMDRHTIYDLIHDGQRLPLYRTWGWVLQNPSFSDPDDNRALLAQVLDGPPPQVGAPGHDRWVADKQSNERHERWVGDVLATRDLNRIVPTESRDYKTPTRHGIPTAPILLINVEGTVVSAPHLPGVSVDVGPLLGLDTSRPWVMRDSVRNAHWPTWRALQDLVKRASAHRSTFTVKEITDIGGHPLGKRLTEIWSAAPVFPGDVVFVPTTAAQPGSVVRTRDGRSGPQNKGFTVSYAEEFGLLARPS